MSWLTRVPRKRVGLVKYLTVGREGQEAEPHSEPAPAAGQLAGYNKYGMPRASPVSAKLEPTCCKKRWPIAGLDRLAD